MQAIHDIPLKNLRPGHEFPGASINARQHGRAQDIEQLAASIAEEGLLQPLLAVQSPGHPSIYFVADGNRRLDALQLLAKGKNIPGDALISVMVSDENDPVKALRKSLAAGSQHVALHPVDQFETFVACLDKGDTPEKIADRYALPLKVVKQRLALGGLSPVIRDAWRKGKLNVEAAMAYASTPHHAAQEKHFKRGNYEATNAHQIRHALVGDRHEIDKLLKFVGEKEYKAAGGKLVEDLFGEKGGSYADFGLLQRLTAEKLKAAAEAFMTKGWGWAAIDTDLPNGAAYSWAKKDKPAAEEKKKLGVIVGLTYAGAIEVRTGVIKPSTKGIAGDKTKTDGSPVKKKSANSLSNALKERLEQWRWKALQLALKTDTYPHGITETLAEIARELIRPHLPNHIPEIIRKNFDDLVAGLHDKALQEALLKSFDAKEYFPKAPKVLVLKAITEAGFAAHAEKLKAGTKAAAWKFALGNLAKTGWLPPELRLGAYPGPGAGKKKPAPKKRKR